MAGLPIAQASPDEQVASLGPRTMVPRRYR